MIILKNGLRVVLRQRKSVSTNFQITFNTGSINEQEGEKGFSHLVEHLLFEGTKSRPTNLIITSEVENLGGDFNAATSNESTTFYIKILSKHHRVALDILSDIVLNATFEKFEKEKQIVLEEIKMIDDNSRYYQWILLEKELFEGTAHGFPVYGLVEDVQNATKENLLKYYKKHYVPNNAILTIVGDFESTVMVKEVEEFFNSWEGCVREDPILLPVNKTKFKQEERDVQQVYMIQGVVTPSITDPDSPVLDVVEAILGKPLSGKIVDEVRNKRGLAYDISVSYENFKKFGFFAINAVIDEANVEQVRKLIREQLLDLANITDDDLKHAKQHIEGKMLLDLEDNHRYSEFLTFWFQACGDDVSDEYLKKVMSVSKEDVKKVAEKYLLDNITEILLVPKKI